MSWRRTGALVAVTGGLAAALFTISAVVARPPELPSSPESPRAAAGSTQSSIETLQERLERLPGDWSAWSALGDAHLAQAVATGDPSHYDRAEKAFARSLQVKAEGNDVALTGQAALAASRHEFDVALELAGRARRMNEYSAANRGVLVDALIELGRYEQAEVELQRMLDLRPGTPSFARASYLRELHGDVRGARLALEQAQSFAAVPTDVVFAARYLGELAFNAGDLAGAERHFGEALETAPGDPTLTAGLARVAAARGDTETAVRQYGDVVQRLPQLSYLVEYGELLLSLGRTAEAAEQFAVVRLQQRLQQAAGVNTDLELALFEADHGDATAALAVAEAEWAKRRSIHVADAYAWALHANGRDAEALRVAKQAARLGTRSASFAYHRGMIEKSLGQQEAAQRSLARALELNPHFSPFHAKRAQSALDELRGDG